jgi:hypothetical protein
MVIWKSSVAALTGFFTSTWWSASNEKRHGGPDENLSFLPAVMNHIFSRSASSVDMVIWKSSVAVLTGFSTSTWGFALNEKIHGGLFSLP